MKFKVSPKESLILIIFFTICISVAIFVWVSAKGYLNSTSSNFKNVLVENSDIKLRAIEVGKEPELIKAYGTDGTIGYVLSTDLMGAQPKSPKEALKLQAKEKSGRELNNKNLGSLYFIAQFSYKAYLTMFYDITIQ